MRKLAFFGLLLAAAVLPGCTGVVKSPAEIDRTVGQVLDMDIRQMTDDWNMLWLADRQYRFTRWHLR